MHKFKSGNKKLRMKFELDGCFYNCHYQEDMSLLLAPIFI
jgi:hypothetical protein